MIKADFLSEILHSQAENLDNYGYGMERDCLDSLHYANGYALIISGIRRCGKSTLMRQIVKKEHGEALFVNFDDPRLYDFEISDFIKLDDLIAKSSMRTLMFDEIQVVKGWERYVRQKLDEGYNVYVTGSNASLLSRELGTSLTGRHITNELFPFSYNEFCRFKDIGQNQKTLEKYMNIGGFPEYVKTEREDILVNLLDDILVRDISIRYNIKDTRGLRRLAVFLFANIGNLTSASKLREPSGINSVTTILEYLSHLELSYLITLVPKFDYSLKKQMINPKKIYAVDMGLVTANVSKTKQDLGHKLENVVFNHLRMRFKEIYYHSNKSAECDFIIVDKGAVAMAVQVCLHLDNDNIDRELNGLRDAMATYNLTEGFVVTESQKDSFTDSAGVIKVLPFAEFIQKNDDFATNEE